MTLRITYVKGGRRMSAVIAGTSSADATRWMMRNEPGIYIFKVSPVRRPSAAAMRAAMFARFAVAADETGTGAHVPPRRRP